jgi:hypothetical protein
MDKELQRIQFNYDKNRKKKMTVQIHNLINYISGSRAIEIFCSEIIRMTNNPYIKDDPEAILLNLKDHCDKRLKFAVEEKTKAYTELSALRKILKMKDDDFYEEELPGFKPL